MNVIEVSLSLSLSPSFGSSQVIAAECREYEAGLIKITSFRILSAYEREKK